MLFFLLVMAEADEVHFNVDDGRKLKLQEKRRRIVEG